ncbi:hypothetical protein ACLOJK_007714 [Asimina triloba]
MSVLLISFRLLPPIDLEFLLDFLILRQFRVFGSIWFSILPGAGNRWRFSPESVRYAELLQPEVPSQHRQHSESMEKCNSPTLGPTGMIRRKEFVRVIIQSLFSLGYKKAAALLESESGISHTSPELSLIQSQILDARWDDCIRTLNSIDDLPEETRASAVFLVFRQCFFEFLNSGDVCSALKLLQRRISPLRVDRKRVHLLASDVVSLAELEFGRKDGVSMDEFRRKLLSELEALLPPPITLPGRRLEHLVETAVNVQKDFCVYHNSAGLISLYEDHRCTRDQIPTETVQPALYPDDGDNVVDLTKSSYVTVCHIGESISAWMAKEKKKKDKNGKEKEETEKWGADIRLIKQNFLHLRMTGDIDLNLVSLERTVVMKHVLNSHRNPVSFVSWSPDDTMLLTCGNVEVLKLWDVETGKCKHTFGERGLVVSSCAWFPDSKRLLSGSCDPDKCIYTWDIEGNELDARKGARMPKVSDLAVTPDGEYLISTCDDKEIRIYNFHARTERIITEDHSITSLSVSRDGQYFIVNVNSQEIHLWDVAGMWNTPLKYMGHKQGQYVIRSCFGGSDSAFIASGSENSQGVNPLESMSTHISCFYRFTSGTGEAVNLLKF